MPLRKSALQIQKRFGEGRGSDGRDRGRIAKSRAEQCSWVHSEPCFGFLLVVDPGGVTREHPDGLLSRN
jgi:hypothetical protein